MDETKPTSAPASANRERLAGIKRSVTRALIVVALLVALCVFMGLPLILSGVIVFLASSSAALFTFLVVTAVFTELFDAKEWARTRLGEKRASVDLRPFFADLGGILRPVLRPFSSWRPFSLGRFGEAVLLPDSMAIFGVCLASLVMTSIVMTSVSISTLMGQQPVTSSFLYLPLGALAVLASPFVLTAVLWVSREEVRLIRFFVVIPYWVHRVPHDAELPLWGFEDGIAFKSPSRALYELQLGTPTSALRLSHHIAAVLEKAGWQHSPPGHLPRMLRI
jgi:hypothetical protein